MTGESSNDYSTACKIKFIAPCSNSHLAWMSTLPLHGSGNSSIPLQGTHSHIRLSMNLPLGQGLKHGEVIHRHVLGSNLPGKQGGACIGHSQRQVSGFKTWGGVQLMGGHLHLQLTLSSVSGGRHVFGHSQSHVWGLNWRDGKQMNCLQRGLHRHCSSSLTHSCFIPIGIHHLKQMAQTYRVTVFWGSHIWLCGQCSPVHFFTMGGGQ